MGQEEAGTGARNRALFFGCVAVNRGDTGSLLSPSYYEVLDGLLGSFHPSQGPFWAAYTAPTGPPEFPNPLLGSAGLFGVSGHCMAPAGLRGVPGHECPPLLLGSDCMQSLGHCLTPWELHGTLIAWHLLDPWTFQTHCSWYTQRLLYTCPPAS